MIDSLINLVGPGQVNKSEITSTFNNTKKIVQLQQFRHKQMRSFTASSPRIAIGSSGQHALIGGTSNHMNVFIQSINIGSLSSLENPSNNTIAYHEINWDGEFCIPYTQLCRLQFVPGGNDNYAATWINGVRIIDSNTNQLITHYHPLSAHWSDWHPRDKHLIAIGSRSYLDLIDIRQRPAVRTDEKYSIINAQHQYYGGDCISLSSQLSCLWNPKDDNHLVTVCDGLIETYDRRTKTILHSIDHGVDMFDMQMTPNGKYLFGWGRKTHRLSQWKYDSDGVRFVRNFPLDVWELGSRKRTYRDNNAVQSLQYHVTDTHLFMPNKSTNWMPNETNKTAVQVFDVETGEKVNEMKAVKRGYDPTSETYDYARVDAVVGLSNGHHEDQLYTLSDKCELGVWSFSGVSQEETDMQLLELERGSEELMEYPVSERPADDRPNSSHQGADQGTNRSLTSNN